MTPEQWQTIRPILESALELDPDSRASYLDGACADALLRRELESLIAFHEQAGTQVLVPGASPILSGDDEPHFPLLTGKRIGAYQIVQEIAVGGMGAVHLAVRADGQYKQQVALKLVRADLGSGITATRFRNERQILASLDHPNIAKILDGGATAEGLPYFVMEFIDGQPITAYCDQHKLTVDARLEVFRTVCSAVHYAHKRQVIHRDIKPTNILITSEGAPKLVDFGIAKILDPNLLSESAALTTGGQWLMTPEYASPEQFRGEAITAATDVYSLGLVLYELLTGHRAHRFPSRLPHEMARAVLETDPEKPSTVIRSKERRSGEIPPTEDFVSGLRGDSPDKLRRRLTGDVDNIVLKAIRKEPRERYASADQLSEDIRRHLESLPILARKGKVAYRSRKYILRHKVGVAAAAVIFVSLISNIGLTWRGTHKLTEKDTVVLADFMNTTGDPVFDGTLRQGLSVQLEQSPFLNLLSDQRITQTLSQIGKPEDARLTNELAREVCQRTGSTATLEESIEKVGTQYLLTLKAVNCSNGESLASTEAQASDKNHVLNALGMVASDIRSKLGESLRTVQEFDTPVNEATTSSLEALQAYNLGQRTMVGNDYRAAVALFQGAIRLDPKFATAYAALGTTYINLGETGLATENTRTAYELRARASERERFYIESHYHHFVTGDLEKARQTYELWAQSYPRDVMPLTSLGNIHASLGQYDKALMSSREAVRLNPRGAMRYANLVRSYIHLDRLKEAQATIEEARAQNLNTAIMPLYQLAFLQGDPAAMAKAAAWSAGDPGTEDELLYYQANTAAYFGRLKQARDLFRRARVSAQQREEKEAAAEYEADAAVQEGLFGNIAKARLGAQRALKFSKGRDVQFAAALALAFARDAEQAEKLINDLADRFPEDTTVQFNYRPTVLAQIALSRNDPLKALNTLQAATPYELGDPAYGAALLNLYPVYVRGGAYLVARQGAKAAVEFQKVLDHPGVVLNESIGALAHLQIGRAYAIAGGADKAKAAYQEFLALWKNADADCLILKQAKAEYAKLH